MMYQGQITFKIIMNYLFSQSFNPFFVLEHLHVKAQNFTNNSKTIDKPLVSHAPCVLTDRELYDWSAIKSAPSI